MSKTDLQSFLRGKPKSEPSPVKAQPERNWVPLTIKVHRDEHRRLRDLATAERSSTQDLGTEGLNAALAARGLPPMRNYLDD